MDQNAINIVLTIVIFIGGIIISGITWFAHTLWTAVKENQKEVADLRVKMAADYVSTSELTGAITDLKGIMTTLVSDMRNDIGYIRGRVDNIPHRRTGDPAP